MTIKTGEIWGITYEEGVGWEAEGIAPDGDSFAFEVETFSEVLTVLKRWRFTRRQVVDILSDEEGRLDVKVDDAICDKDAAALDRFVAQREAIRQALNIA